MPAGRRALDGKHLRKVSSLVTCRRGRIPSKPKRTPRTPRKASTPTQQPRLRPTFPRKRIASTRRDPQHQLRCETQRLKFASRFTVFRSDGRTPARGELKKRGRLGSLVPVANDAESSTVASLRTVRAGQEARNSQERARAADSLTCDPMLDHFRNPDLDGLNILLGFVGALLFVVLQREL